MKAYLITWNVSDGNDCTVYDTVTAAESEDAALEKLDRAIQAACPDAESDGDYVGYYFGCSEDCSEDCEGHGGTSLREVREFDTEEAARKAKSTYHVNYEID
jgi:hypothetical protein